MVNFSNIYCLLLSRHYIKHLTCMVFKSSQKAYLYGNIAVRKNEVKTPGPEVTETEFKHMQSVELHSLPVLCDSTYHVQSVYCVLGPVLDISCTGSHNLPGREILLLNPVQETDAQNIMQLAQSHTFVNGKSPYTHKEDSETYLTIGVNNKDQWLRSHFI